ncbi:DNA polymerase III subunit alpha [bacterium]|nr:MAG: DNA polymerase III subunit alpha [bacterium]
MFTHLHVHSYYTYGKGSSSIESLVVRAKECGYDTLAITDLNTMAGTVEFYHMCREYGLFSIIGCEIDDPKDSDLKAVLLCRNGTGYRRLCELVSARQIETGFDLAEALRQNAEGLFVLSYSAGLLQALKGYVIDLYGELVLLPSLKKRNRLIFEWCQKNKIPLVITNDVYFDEPAKHETYRILASIKQLTTVYDLQDEVTDEQYLKSPEEMKKGAASMKESLANVQKIVKACQFEFELKKYHCARYRTMDGKVIDSSPEMLRQLAHDGLIRRYAITDKSKPFNYDVLIQRLNYELEVISNLNFCDYFLICWDMVTYAHSQGYWHVGRGSAANSLVSYCLGLTEVDPIRYNLYFERFLNYSRGKPPDIDLDFNWRFRDRMLEYIYRRYGQERVAMMSSIHTMHARGALREVAKAYGISERELDTFRKYIPHTLARNLEVLSTKYPEAKNLKLNSDLYQKILKTAAQLDGFPHYSGIHSSGVVITEKPITHNSALERSANGFIKTQVDMYSGEDVGLIKFDVLAVRGLGTIEDAVRNIEAEKGQAIDIFNWGKIFADEKAKELMSTGKTIGVVHAESPFIRNAMRITKAETFELLYIILGMVRTGCVESGMMYTFIERLLDPQKRKEALPALMEILPETFGVMIFEEDVIKVLHFVGSLTLEESDMVRRYMSGKRVSAKVIQELKAKFFRNCMKKIDGIKEIETLWKQIESFSGFSFCKAHSASYALMAFQGLYLKIHYPAHYMAAVLSNEGGFYSASAYISECRRLGLTILPPDINLSDREYKADGNAIRVGLRFIAGIGSESLNLLMEARSERSYDSLPDFVLRSGVGHEEIVTLIKIGCFDAFNKKRTLLIALLDAIIHIQKSRLSQEMFSLDLTHYEQMLSHLDDMTAHEKLASENDLLSYFVAQHPLEFFPKQINSPSVVKAKDLSRYKNRKVKMIGWLVSAKRIRTRDKKDEEGNIREGQYMKFMTLEDLTGIYDTVLFPKVYAQVAEQTLSYGPFCVEGIVDERYNTVNVTRIALVRNKLPQMDIDASLTIEKQEVYAKQKSDSDTYSDGYIVPIEMETIELQIIKAS